MWQWQQVTFQKHTFPPAPINLVCHTIYGNSIQSCGRRSFVAKLVGEMRFFRVFGRKDTKCKSRRAICNGHSPSQCHRLAASWTRTHCRDSRRSDSMASDERTCNAMDPWDRSCWNCYSSLYPRIAF